jgi:hypothetical protein
MKPLSIVLIVVNALPLLAYPFALLANLMGYAALANAGATGGFAFAAKAFMVLSTLYPLALTGFLIPTIRNMKRARHGRAACWQAGMCGYLCLVAACAVAWGMLEPS